MLNLALNFFVQKNQKVKAMEFIIEGLKKDSNSVLTNYLAACIYAWNSRFEDSKVFALEFLKDLEFSKEIQEGNTNYFILLLAKGATQELLELFTSPEGEAAHLKDKFKPIYYALLKKLEHPDFLRMGEELAQTVEEILARAEKMAVEYA
ncbi:MAG: hypothetical protein IPH04_01070 [Saprospirales bacterium]|nr:hypothetical protein [Saprospirales bacterium]